MSTTTTAPTHAAPRVTDAMAPVRSRARKQLLRRVLMLLGIVVVAVGSLIYWLQGGRYVSIDNAYVRAAKQTLSTDVSGIVAEVPVHEGQLVHKGDVLVRLDPQPFVIALAGAKASLTQVGLTMEAMKQDYQRMLRDISVKEAQVQLDQVVFDRRSSLVDRGDVARSEYDAARFQLLAETRALDSLRVAAQVQLAKLSGKPDVDVTQTPEYLKAQAVVQEARRKLDHSVINAPSTGVVTMVDTLQPGMYLIAGTAAFGMVSTEDMWVEANPKETQLTWVKPGDPVAVTVDTYRGSHLARQGGQHRAEQRLGVLGAAGAEFQRQLGEGRATHPGPHPCRSHAGRAGAALRHERRGIESTPDTPGSCPTCIERPRTSRTTALAAEQPTMSDAPAEFARIPNRGIITACTMAATLMQALDSTIANVALPYMQGSLSASYDEITWVLTSYVTAAAIMTAPVGWLATRFGRKNLYLICIIGFTLASMLCGAAQSLPQIVLFRVLQGVFGAALVPLSQATMLDIYPAEQRARQWRCGASA